MRSRAGAAAPYARAGAAAPYAGLAHDAVRTTFELAWFADIVPRLLRAGGEVLDLGCGDGAAARLAGSGLTRYVGVDLAPPHEVPGVPAEVPSLPAAATDPPAAATGPPAAATGPPAEAAFVRHDLREGLGPVGARPFDLYLGTFGVASHLSPAQLGRLLRDVAAHARPGALVALEALGLHSLEWPQLWESRPGPARTLRYRLASEVWVHPWSPAELFRLFERSGVRPLRAADRTVQAGPKMGAYWPGLPNPRAALNKLLGGSSSDLDDLVAPLPPLPAGEAALVHHALAARRRALLRGGRRSASAVWSLEPATAGGFGHGLLVLGRVVG